nr:cyclase family protein [Clostridia bacterium]
MDKIAVLEQTLAGFEMIDLSHEMFPDMPKWPAHTSFAQTRTAFYEEGSYHNCLSVHEHSGTHIDAPAHFVREGEWNKFLSELPLSMFFGRLVKIDMRGADKCYSVTKEDIVKWEAEHTGVLPGDVVAFDFGIDSAWKNDERERIVKDWPGLSGEAAAYLREKGAKIVGTDALAIDTFGANNDPAHHELLEYGVLVVENLANLSEMPDVGYFMCLPLAIRNGSGSPIRAIGLRAK